MKRMIQIVVVLVAVALAAGGLTWYLKKKAVPAASYTTAQVKRGDLVSTIGATGTIEPEEVVDVGAQVAGLIIAFGTDKDGKTIDYGSEIEAGTVLAKIDDSMYAADAGQTAAQVQQAKAQVAAADCGCGQADFQRRADPGARR